MDDYLKRTTHRRHLANLAFLDSPAWLNNPSRTDWHLIRLLKAHCDKDGPSMLELATLIPVKTSDEPFPRFTKETAAKARAALAAAMLKAGGVKVAVKEPS